MKEYGHCDDCGRFKKVIISMHQDQIRRDCEDCLTTEYYKNRKRGLASPKAKLTFKGGVTR